jgi:hypothetical protein
MIQLHPIEAEWRRFRLSRYLRGILCQREAEPDHCGSAESPFTQTTLELRVCKTPSVGASLIED